MEWVEVKGSTVEVAVEVALQELGLDSPDHADVEVLQEPERGFLGLGSREAIVRVKPKPRPRRRRRRGRGGGGEKRPARSQEPNRKERKNSTPPAGRASKNSGESVVPTEEPEVTVEEQAEVVKSFLTGLLQAFGLEGSVAIAVEEDIIIADITGEQTEALIGPRGTIMQAMHELTRTVVQRKTRQGARIRLDIAGYAARRREALAIYAQRLADQVKEDGQEVMLEPMNPADRKVIHDALTDVAGVRTYSEGQEPRRSVVVSPAEDKEARA